jgi:tetratricopeptide (TPR) repeat protein
MNRLRSNGSGASQLGLGARRTLPAKQTVDAEALIDQAWDLLEEGAYKKAFAKLELVPSSGRGDMAYLVLMSMVCDELKLHGRRVEAARQVVAADPTIEIHWVVLARAAFQVRGGRAAVRIWHEALRKDPLFALVRWNLAQHYCLLGRLRAAREELKIALYLDPQLIEATMDEPGFAPIWETIAEADPPPPEEGEEWREA